MGFFKYLFGIGEKPAKKIQRRLSKVELDELLSCKEIKSMTVAEKRLIIDEIGRERHGDGKISLEHINVVLGRLEMAGKISENDRAGVFAKISALFAERYDKQNKQTNGQTD